MKTIAQRYEVAVGTADKALAILRQDGLIVSAKRLGHYTT